MKGRVLVVAAVLSTVLAACGQSVVSGDAASSTAVPVSESPTIEPTSTTVETSLSTTTTTAVSAAISTTTSTTTPSTTTSPIPQPKSAAPSTTINLVPTEGLTMEETIQLAKEDLAGRLKIDAGEITVVSSESVTFNNSSLGCPQKGMSYLQVLTDGYRIVLVAGGVQYDYRVSTRGAIVLCQT